MKSFDELQQETTDLHVDFLFTDLSAAATFLDIARTTHDGATRTRNLHNATVAHDAVLRFIPRVPMSADLKHQLRAMTSSLKGKISAIERLARIEAQKPKHSA